MATDTAKTVKCPDCGAPHAVKTANSRTGRGGFQWHEQECASCRVIFMFNDDPASTVTKHR